MSINALVHNMFAGGGQVSFLCRPLKSQSSRGLGLGLVDMFSALASCSIKAESIPGSQLLSVWRKIDLSRIYFVPSNLCANRVAIEVDIKRRWYRLCG